VAPPGSDLRQEHELVAELREVLKITDDRLIAPGNAAWVLPKTLSGACAADDRNQ